MEKFRAAFAYALAMSLQSQGYRNNKDTASH